MSSAIADREGAARTVRLYPWFRFFDGLIFWQAVWFLYFQNTLSAAEAILLYMIADIAVSALEVPSGWFSDRFGRRKTLIGASVAGVAGAGLIATGNSFAAFAAGQILLGTARALMSGTDTALLYESLSTLGRDDEVEAQELKAWRFGFAALALSAFTGGIMAGIAGWLPFAAGTLAMTVGVWIAFRFVEPPRTDRQFTEGGEIMRLRSLTASLTHPVLRWIFALAVLMYVFSHIPFVFGQPFILQALDSIGQAATAPMLSGTITAVMMMVSILVSLVAPRIRDRLGLAGILILAFGMQIALIGTLWASLNLLASAALLFRMVPNSLSQPFILARVQPLLASESRATYLSVQSLVGRLLFVATLWAAAGIAPDAGQMEFAEIRTILGWYLAAGALSLAGLAIAARFVPVEPRHSAS